MTTRLLISNANCVLPNETRITSVLCEDGRILDIDPPATSLADETINANGLALIPGCIDDQVHFRDPGLTHKEDLHTGSMACAAGGVTTFLEMPNTNPTTTTIDSLHAKLQLASEKCVVNYGFYIGATGTNTDELKRAQRTPGIKIFIGSSTGPLLVDEQDALEEIFGETSLPICAHCEDETTVRANSDRLNGGTEFRHHSQIRDHAAARIATARAIDLSTRHNHPFHVLHVSTADEVELIRAARATGSGLISAEACPHHLLFHIDDYDRLGSKVQMNPSIKTAADNEALWNALRDGVIEVVATDHAPHTLDEKAKPYPKSPSGLPAVENSLALMLNAVNDGRCTLEQIVEWMSAAPARVWNIANKGAIKPGYDADLVLVDVNKTKTVQDEDQFTKAKWSPWAGETLKGWPVMTFVRGQCVYRDGTVNESVRGAEAAYDRSTDL